MTTPARYLLLIIALNYVTPAHAQMGTRSVYIEKLKGAGAEDNFHTQVIAAFKARILGTQRYQITEIPGPAELVVNITCMDIGDLTKHSIKGGVCSYYFAYWPTEFQGLSTPICTLFSIASNEAAEIGESVFQDFVSSSTEQALATKRKSIKDGVDLFNLRHDKSSPQ